MNAMTMTRMMTEATGPGAKLRMWRPARSLRGPRERARLTAVPSPDGRGGADGAAEEADERGFGAEEREDGSAAHPHGFHESDFAGAFLH